MTAAEVEVIIQGDEKPLKRSLDRARDEMGRFKTDGTRVMRDAMNSMGNSVLQGIGQAIGNFSIQGAVQGVQALARSMIQGNADMEQYATQFEVLLGNAAKAKTMLVDLEKYATATPFEMSDLAAASQTMLSFGLDAQQIFPSLQMLGDISMGNQEKFKGLSLAFSQIQATGRLMGQDLLQLVNAGFNPLQIISEKTGRSMKDLKKDMEDGKISSAAVTAAMQIATSEGGRFYGGMEKGSKTFNGLMSTLRDQIAKTFREMGGPLFEKAKLAVQGLINILSGPSGKALVGGLVAIGAAIATAAAGLAAFAAWGKVAGVVAGVAAGFTKLGGAMGILRIAIGVLTGPVGWVIAAATLIYAAWKNNWGGIREVVIGAVGYIVAWWRQNLPLIQKTAQTVLGWLKTAWEAILPVVMRVWSGIVTGVSTAWAVIKTAISTALQFIGGYLKAVMQVINGDWAGAWGTIQETARGVFTGMRSMIARSMAGILGVVQNGVQGIADAWYGLKESMGMGDGSGPGKVSFLDGAIKGLNAYADAADRARKSGDSVKPGGVNLSKMFGFNLPSLGSSGGGGGGKKAPDVDFGKLMGDGEGKKKAKLTQAQKDMKQEAEALARQLAETTKAIDLNGQTAESAGLQYDLTHGRIMKVNQGLAKQVLHYLKKKEAQDAARESAAKAAQVDLEWADAIEEARRSVLLATAATERDRIAIERYGKSYGDLTDAKNRQRVAALAEQRDREKEIEGRKTANEWVRQTVQSLQDELAARSMTTRVQKAQAELAKADLATLNWVQRAAVLAAAAKLDMADAADAAAESMKRYREAWTDVFRRAQEARRAQEEAAGSRFQDEIREQTDRIRALSSASGAYQVRLERLAEGFGVGATQAERIASGMDRAREVMELTLRADAIQDFQERMRVMADRITDTFADMFRDLMEGGFGNFFQNVMTGFRRMVAEMAREWLASQVRNMIGRAIGSLIGAAAGGSGGGAVDNGPGIGSGVQFAAVGGPVLANRAVVVGERGPELFVPNGNGTIKTAEQTRAMGQPMNVTINISTPDPGAFRASQDQIATQMAARLRQATKQLR